MRESEAATIRQGIAERYRKVAASPAGLFRYPTGEASALGLGYPPERLAAIPPAIRERFVGVGNPLALGAIRPGESVLDLGCGAGLDALVAAQIVGPTGRVVGIDLSRELLAVAEAGRMQAGFAHVEFREAAIEALPFPAASFAVAISNGVLNLVPDKPAALREIFGVLRPDGRLQACDIGLVGDTPPPDKAPWSD
ncbi:MAG TPA: methyltransferase domain-containing protein [Candidatus Methylomirabilis sp.]|nr:methyltransferase domain-containing protein [Candidatus Methylomirabilis sp.]HSB79039.1 methyltransferase domain-containing protein [Candidatus Methylomirabilis sp.]